MEILYFVLGFASLFVNVHSYNKIILEMFMGKYSAKVTDIASAQEGTCSLGPVLPPIAVSHHIRYFVAVNSKQYAGGLACGMCLRVRGNGEPVGKERLTGEFLVMVNDECSHCGEGGIDIGEGGDGEWDAYVQAVQCPVEDSKIEYKFSGSSEWYIRMQIRNTRVPLQSVFVEREGAYEALVHTTDGYWEYSGGEISFPLNIKMIGVTDEPVFDIIPRIENDVVIEGNEGAQFEHDWDLP